MNPLYNQLNPRSNNQMFSNIKQFQRMFSGDPQKMVQEMLNSGRISQAQLNQYAQQANQIYEQMKDFM